MANSYLDTELIWKFSLAHLESYPDHIICLNREIFIDAVKMAKITRLSGYTDNWLFDIQ